MMMMVVLVEENCLVPALRNANTNFKGGEQRSLY